jgi:hypothetical protein
MGSMALAQGTGTRVLIATMVCLSAVRARAEPQAELSGETGAELRAFLDRPDDARQFEHFDTSLYLAPKFNVSWRDGKVAVTLSPFARVDQHDARRTHADLREAMLKVFGGSWELGVGVGRVYWGVTEILNLVNVVNQIDWVENLDAKDRLGQPMLRLGARLGPAGMLELFWLPFFRERTYPGLHGRPRFDLLVTHDAKYTSTWQERMADAALRWSANLGEWDLGLSGFAGTSRDPVLEVVPPADAEAEPMIRPRYEWIVQAGADVQWTHEGWLWKLEAIYRRFQGPAFAAATGGVEYTFGSIYGSSADLGLLCEYMWDGRDNGSLALFQHDIGGGFRLTLNDVSATELLVAGVLDTSSLMTFVNVEASRRLWLGWKIVVEARAFYGPNSSDPLTGWRNESHMTVVLAHYF